MSNEKISLSEGFSCMEKCLDALLSEQRQTAHNAIDMDDWDKAQEILAVAKKNISAVEAWRAQFSAFKKDVLQSDLIAGNGGAASKEPADEPGAGAEEPAREPDKSAQTGKSEPPENEIVSVCEDMIVKFPFAMAIINSAADIGGNFTYDDVTAESDMKSPVQLSNGLWVDSAAESGLTAEIITRFCENANKG